MSLSARVLRRSDLSVRTELPESFARQWQDQLNQPGSGSLALLNADPARRLVSEGDVVQFIEDGTVRFAWLVRSIESDTIAPTPDQERSVLSGPGLLAVLDEAVVYPSPGLDSLPLQDTRTFSWPAPDYDDSAWGNAVELASGYGDRGPTMPSDPLHDAPDDPSYWWGATMPKWPDPAAWYIWTSTGPGGAPIANPLEWSPAGNVYFRRSFEAPAGVVALQYHALFDAEGEIFLDGIPLAAGTYGTEPNVNTFSGSMPISAGPHTIAARLSNDVDPEADEWHNPGAFLFSAYAVDAAGGVIGNGPIVRSDSSWKALPYPDPAPGVTPGRALRIVVAEAQARGCFPGLTTTFTDTADTDGTPWTTVADISTKVGGDLLAFAGELATAYLDLWLNPATMQLDAWVQDARGTIRPNAVLHPPTDPGRADTGNIGRLTHRRVS